MARRYIESAMFTPVDRRHRTLQAEIFKNISCNEEMPFAFPVLDGIDLWQRSGCPEYQRDLEEARGARDDDAAATDTQKAADLTLLDEILKLEGSLGDGVPHLKRTAKQYAIYAAMITIVNPLGVFQEEHDPDDDRGSEPAAASDPFEDESVSGGGHRDFLIDDDTLQSNIMLRRVFKFYNEYAAADPTPFVSPVVPDTPLRYARNLLTKHACELKDLIAGFDDQNASGGQALNLNQRMDTVHSLIREYSKLRLADTSSTITSGDLAAITRPTGSPWLFWDDLCNFGAEEDTLLPAYIKRRAGCSATVVIIPDRSATRFVPVFLQAPSSHLVSPVPLSSSTEQHDPTSRFVRLRHADGTYEYGKYEDGNLYIRASAQHAYLQTICIPFEPAMCYVPLNEEDRRVLYHYYLTTVRTDNEVAADDTTFELSRLASSKTFHHFLTRELHLDEEALANIMRNLASEPERGDRAATSSLHALIADEIQSITTLSDIALHDDYVRDFASITDAVPRDWVTCTFTSNLKSRANTTATEFSWTSGTTSLCSAVAVFLYDDNTRHGDVRQQFADAFAHTSDPKDTSRLTQFLLDAAKLMAWAVDEKSKPTNCVIHLHTLDPGGGRPALVRIFPPERDSRRGMDEHVWHIVCLQSADAEDVFCVSNMDADVAETLYSQFPEAVRRYGAAKSSPYSTDHAKQNQNVFQRICSIASTSASDMIDDDELSSVMTSGLVSDKETVESLYGHFTDICPPPPQHPAAQFTFVGDAYSFELTYATK
jgi:hypothetical protein